MLPTLKETAVIVLCPIGVVLFLWVLNHLWPSSERHDHNDIIGWQISILGTIYAVMMGFMLFAVWSSYLSTDVNAEAESNALVSVYRLADGLPQAPREQIHLLARQYADIVIEKEWPAMHHGGLSAEGSDTVQHLWDVTVSIKPPTLAEQTCASLLLSEISQMSEHRRIRHHNSQSLLPGQLWTVLILGGIVTIFSACLFGIEKFRLHSIQVFSLALVITIILVAISEIDHPFEGRVHLSPSGFVSARAPFSQSR